MKFYTIAEVANILKVKPVTVEDWCRKGRIKRVKLSNNKDTRISEEALHDFINSCSA